MRTLPLARLLALVLPLACVGLFGRALYTPDEPREASLVVSMATQADKSLPELAGRPFAEKPPLLYWLGGASVAALGASAGAARLPNLLYLLVTVLAAAALAQRAAGPAAGFAAGVVAATALQLYQVLIWLATDAPLVAGVAVALLGAQVGLTAATRAERVAGYLTFQLGLGIAFFAKGPAGWLVPVSALLVVLVAERRLRELLRAEFWYGVPVLLATIGAWLYCVMRSPAGAESLRVMFWYNLVGRAVPLAAPAEFAYATGHRNSAGKYLLELPLYLLPWVPLAFAALRRAPRGWRMAGATGTAWRLGLGAIVPATLALSFAATARGVYYGPPELGFVLLIGLYVASAGTALDRIDRICWRLTGALIALVAIALAGLAAVFCFAPALRDPAGITLGAVALLGGSAAVWLALTPGIAAAGALPRLALALVVALVFAAGPLYRELNACLSLEPLAARAERAAGGRPLIVVAADETTAAMAMLYLPTAELPLLVNGTEAERSGKALAALEASGGRARILWPVAGGPRWDLAAWLAFLGYGALGPSTPAALPAAFAALRVECRLVRPGGRSLVVLSPADAPAPAAGTCD